MQSPVLAMLDTFRIRMMGTIVHLSTNALFPTADATRSAIMSPKDITTAHVMLGSHQMDNRAHLITHVRLPIVVVVSLSVVLISVAKQFVIVLMAIFLALIPLAVSSSINAI